MGVWVYEVAELYDAQRGSLQRYRVIRWSSNDPDNLIDVCTHSHATHDEALKCAEVTRVIEHEFRERIVESPRAQLTC